MVQKESKKTVRIFALASFFNDLGSDMIYPIWPLFVTTYLGASMAALGFIDGLGDAVVSISKAASGYTSDRIRRRKCFIWAGYILGSLSRVGYALSSTWQHVVPFRVLDRAGKIRSAPRDAIIADISTKDERGKNFGLVRAMDNIGAVCGIILCILLFNYLGYRNLFLLAALPSGIATLLIVIFIKEKRTSDKKNHKGLSLRDLNKNYKLFLFLSSIFALGSFSYSFLLLYAKEFGFQLTVVPILYLIFTAIASLVSLPFGSLSDKIGRKNVLIVSFVFWALVCLSFILIHNHLSIIFTFVLYGLHKGALDPVQHTLVAELAPAKYRATSLGGFQMIMGLCAFPASLMAGIFWDKISIEAPFYFSLCLTIVATIMLLFVKET